MSMPSFILAGAEFGVNLLQARNERRAADADRRMARSADRLRQTMITSQARVDTSERLERFRTAVGSQNAAIGAMGVVGGRTARLFRQQTQMTFRRAQDAARMQESAQRSQSRVQQFQQASQARARAAQARINLFTSGIETGQGVQQILEQERVE